MKTSDIIETLLYHNPKIKESLVVLGVINDNNKFEAINHTEYETEIKKIKNPMIFCTMSSTQMIIIVELDITSRISPGIIIKGTQSEFTTFSKTKIIDMMDWHLTTSDFVPKPFMRKIICIKDINTLDGIVLSEYEKNGWITGDPREIKEHDDLMVMRSKLLLKQILGAIYDQ